VQQRGEQHLPIWYNHGVGSPIDNRVTGPLAELAARRDGLRLLVVFGSRARGEAHERSDWDLGYLGEPGLDADRLLADVVLTLGSDRVDLVDLARASALLRYRAARDGVVLHEAVGEFDRFRVEAISFYCEVQPVIGEAYRRVLQTLPRRAGTGS
jgi:predicted nucleotidyltransferase